MPPVPSLCWAVLAIALKYTLDFVDSGSIVWFRMLTAAVCVSMFFAVKNPKQLKILWNPPRLAVIAGLFLAVNYFSYMKGLELTSIINAQVMIQFATVFLILAGIYYFKETLSFLAMDWSICCCLRICFVLLGSTPAFFRQLANIFLWKFMACSWLFNMGCLCSHTKKTITKNKPSTIEYAHLCYCRHISYCIS